MSSTEHFCPGCGASQTWVERYPWHFCRACLDTAQSGTGRPLIFSNASMSGGLTWTYRDEPKNWRSVSTVACLIRGRPVLVQDARFGGVVAQPIDDTFFYAKPKGLQDLTGRYTKALS